MCQQLASLRYSESNQCDVLQTDARQDNGWLGSSITHEIMIPLDLWGNYGAHQTAGGRNPGRRAAIHRLPSNFR